MTDIIRQYDNSVLLMFIGVCSFALNWYVFPGALERRVMTLVAILSVALVLAVEVISR